MLTNSRYILSRAIQSAIFAFCSGVLIVHESVAVSEVALAALEQRNMKVRRCRNLNNSVALQRAKDALSLDTAPQTSARCAQRQLALSLYNGVDARFIIHLLLSNIR
ncbi:unnamed protein product [Pieris macdunnoughi]|uniref:Uncharacterized protein n=1 Tax=Pieris macdunnoughi TaxID=345717 RepID=A0A821S4I6_9NEOP|nr:unnamed protein product [Pieris macdunnoughi]